VRSLRIWDTGLGALLAILVLAVNVGTVSSQLGFIHQSRQVKEGDQWRYLSMARDPGRTKALSREDTYCWRVAVPTMARWLRNAGLNLHVAFWLLTNVFLFGFLLVTWVYLRDLGFETPFRVAGLLLLGLTQGAVRWYEYQYWMTDPPALFLIALALLFIGRGWHAALHAPGVLAALVRESYIVVFPYYFIRLLRTGTPFFRAALRTASVAIVPVLILIGLRVLIVPDHPGSMVRDFMGTMDFRYRHLADQPYMFTVGAWGVLFPLLLLFPGRIPGMVRRRPEDAFVVVFFASLCTVANNTERELGYALPAVLPAALFFLRSFVRETGLPLVPVLAATVLVQVLFFLEQRYVDPTSSMWQPTSLRLSLAMAAFWLLARVALRTRRRGGDTPEADGLYL
jgi:hypothetical protein